jgi:hypothetical protein
VLPAFMFVGLLLVCGSPATSRVRILQPKSAYQLQLLSIGSLKGPYSQLISQGLDVRRECNDPVIFCSGVILNGETHEHTDGRRDQALDSAA